MIKVYISNKKIEIVGHAGFAEYGKDIVCASASSIVTTSVNLALRIDANSLEYTEKPGLFTIDIKSNDSIIVLVLENMIAMLNELALTYKKNIKIIEEEKL